MKRSIYIFLLATIVVLLLTDIIIRIWFASDLNLVFNSTAFNNLTTPIVSIISIGIYSLTLLYVIKQNQVIQSQNLRPYFDREIDRLIKTIKKTKFKTSLKFTSEDKTEFIESYNGFNYTQLIYKVFDECRRDEQFIQDYERSKHSNQFELQYIHGRSYADKTIFLSDMSGGLHNRFKYDSIKDLIIEITSSKLIDEEQVQLKRRIKREILQNYLSILRFNSYGLTPFVPDIFVKDKTLYYRFAKLGDTAFAADYEWFKNNLPE